MNSLQNYPINKINQGATVPNSAKACQNVCEIYELANIKHLTTKCE